MRLLTSTLLCSVATLFATLLLFSQGCDGAGHDLTASSSGITEPPHTERLIRTRVWASQYMDVYLKPMRIKYLDRSSEQHPPRPLDPTLPFYERRIPLFPVSADPQTVAQALRDYGNVGIVDLQQQDARWIEYNDGNLRQQSFEKLGEVLRTFSLGPNIHTVVKAVWGQVAPPPTKNIDDLPHFQGMPIMIPNHQDAGSLYVASSQDRRAFWFPRATRRYMLIDPRSPSIYRDLEANDDRTKQINEILDGFESWRQNYGRALAGLKWGRPLHLEAELVRARPKKPKIDEYIRLGSYDATRQQMINALRMHGRFRLYLNSPGQPDGRYRVKLETASTSSQGLRMGFSVKPLTKAQILQEKLLRVRLPAYIEHVA